MMQDSGFGRIQVPIDEDLLDLIPGFLANRQADIGKIRAALDSGDWETAQRLAHSMKGAGGGYGFDRITEIGAAMETAAKERSRPPIEEGLNALADYLERVEVVPE